MRSVLVNASIMMSANGRRRPERLNLSLKRHRHFMELRVNFTLRRGTRRRCR